MHPDEIKALFDRQAASYDTQWAKTIERMRKAYANDVGVLPPEQIASIIAAGGFELPVLFFQAGLIHAWISKRRGD
jgi:hypothetical protein